MTISVTLAGNRPLEVNKWPGHYHLVQDRIVTVPIGKVQAPLALSSSNKVDMMGKSFCLPSSFEINPLSSCKTWQNTIRTQTSSGRYCKMHHKCKKCIIPNLQSREVPRKFLYNGLQGTRVGLCITNQAEVKEEGVSAVLFMLDANGTTD